LLVGLGVLRGWRTAAALAIALCLWRAIDHRFPLFSLQGYEYRTDLIADMLLWGCCLAFVRLRLPAAVSTAAAVGALTILMLMTLGIHVPGLPRNIDYSIPILHACPALLLAAVVSCPAAPIGRLLELSPMRFIGNLSYSLYIWQQLFLGGPGPRLPVFLGLAAAFGCAYLSYRFVEKPCIRWGRQWIKRELHPKTRLATTECPVRPSTPEP
jgi:peptidoglycan/LPS O-acetylase OafA/YrhL